MEAQGSGSHENSGYSGGEEGRGATFPKAARNLLECPVCLELAWPPRRIYQVGRTLYWSILKIS